MLAFVVLSFLGFLAVAFFWTNPHQRPLRLTRADGVIVAIEGMTYGTNHIFQHGSKLLARIQKHVPNAIQKWIGSPLQVTEHTSEPKLIIWYSLFDPATASYVALITCLEMKRDVAKLPADRSLRSQPSSLRK